MHSNEVINSKSKAVAIDIKKYLISYSVLAFALLYFLLIFTGRAYAATPYIASAKITGANTATIVFSEPVITNLSDYSNWGGAFSGRGLISVSGSGSNTITLTFDGGTFSPDSTGSISIGTSTISSADSSPFATSNLQVSDGQAPVITSLTVSSNNYINTFAKTGNTIGLSFTTNEPITTPSVNMSNHDVYAGGNGTGPYNVSYTITDGDTQELVPVKIGIGDPSGNKSNFSFSIANGIVTAVINPPSSVSSLVAPSISEISKIPILTTSQTPTYVFNSNTTGTISYFGDCSSQTTNALSGVNTITFNTLPNGYHGNCSITVSNTSGSSNLYVPGFTVDTTWTPNNEIDTSTPVVSTSYTFTKTLSVGSSGKEVTELQKKLKEEGFLSAVINGHFGPATLKAVKAFQKSHGLSQVGAVGVATRKALNGN